jgi:hypothetical protein
VTYRLTPPERAELTSLRTRLQASERDVRLLREDLRRAEERAQIAERSAREAWAFARVTLRTTPPVAAKSCDSTH